MNTIKRKALSCAILTGLAAAAGSAHAVYLNPDGLGQALIYPYYTVQNNNGNGFNTYLSIVNTTTQAKALKVRFREGKNSREVLDFNLFLSPNDVWVGVVTPVDAADATSAAQLSTPDKSCTNPVFNTAGASLNDPGFRVAFRNLQYSGSLADGAIDTLARTREGYAEVIEMATLANAAMITGVTHVNDVPANCGAVQTQNGSLGLANLGAPTGGLAGTYTLINVVNGQDFNGNATALANLFAAPVDTVLGNENVNLTFADPVSVVVAQQPTGTTVYSNTFGIGRGIDAVSSTMMHSSVINEFSIDNATASNTDWVMTFPTKRYYTAPVTAPFTSAFAATCPAAGGETISASYFNREERTAGANPGDFSPTPGPQGVVLCWESTVLQFRAAGATQTQTGTASGVLGSQNVTALTLATANTQNGWARVSFTGTNAIAPNGLLATTTVSRNANTQATSAVAARFFGLPVIGFAARTLFNGGLTNCRLPNGTTSAACQGAYGGTIDHKYERSITPAP